eukprot:1258571-Pyramimonas_sp.AAC.1
MSPRSVSRIGWLVGQSAETWSGQGASRTTPLQSMQLQAVITAKGPDVPLVGGRPRRRRDKTVAPAL